MRQNGVDGGHDIGAVDDDRPVRPVAQRDMQDGAVLRGVDRLAGEHALAQAGDIGGLGQGNEQADGLVGYPVLGIIEREIAEAQGKPRKALRIVGKQIAQTDLFQRLPMLSQRLQCLVGLRVHRCPPDAIGFKAAA